MKALAIVALVSALALAGCVSPNERVTGAFAEDDTEGTVEVRCTMEVSAKAYGDYGDDHKILTESFECGGPDLLTSESTDLSVESSGAVTSGGGRLHGTVTVTAHYPQSINGKGTASSPVVADFYVGRGSDADLILDIKFPVQGGGKYVLHVVGECEIQKQAWAFWQSNTNCKSTPEFTETFLIKEKGVSLL